MMPLASPYTAHEWTHPNEPYIYGKNELPDASGDMKCCGEADIIDGSNALVGRYENYRKGLRKAKIDALKGWRAYCYQNDGASCSEQNAPIIDWLLPIPKCWECKLINASSHWFGIGDHWWVECKSKVPGAMSKEISFDAFFDVVGAGDVKVNRDKYPYR